MKIKLSMTNQIMIAMVLGVIAGLLFKDQIIHLKFIGDIFLRLIQMGVVILVMGSVIEAIGKLDIKDIGKLGGKIFGLFMATTIFASIIGLIMGNLVKPGIGINNNLNVENTVTNTSLNLQDMLSNFFPNNIIDSMAQGNMIQVIVFAILFGIAISKLALKKEDSYVLNFITNLNAILIQMVKFVMTLAPLGVFSLISYVSATSGAGVIIPLLKFLITLGVSAFFILIVNVLLTAAYVKVSPLKLFKKIIPMSLIAMSTTSSAIALPTKMEDSEKKLGVSSRISNLVNPLGMALNSNGLALFLALSAITLAQFYGIELSLLKQIEITFLATLACLGTVVVPGGGLVALAIIVPAVGLPLESIAILAGIDWFSGSFRTLLNVDIDALVALIIAKNVDEFNRDIFDNSK